MESGTNKESKAAASEEALSPPRPEVAAAGAGEDDAGAAAVSPPAPAASTRPYYECVFCKRGFTTAQALGGHMNIHRRDRAKPSRDTPTGITSVSRNVECYNQYSRHLAYPPASPPATTAPMSSSSSSFTMYYRRMEASAGVDGEAANPSRTSPRELSLFGEAALDHDLHPGLGCHGLDRDGSRTPEEWQRQAGEPERELDLELRLGRRPRH